MPNRIIHILFAVFIWSNIAAQQEHTLPQHKQYTLRDGLSQMQVTSMFQDSRGYLWIGTKGGLNCYNGDQFVSYTRKKYREIVSDYINQVCEDSHGRIWASTPAGILRVDGNNLKFFNIESNPMPWLASDDQGRVWFTQANFPGTDFNIRYIEGDSIKNFQFEKPYSFKLPHLGLHFINDEKKFLLSYDTTLYKINGNKLELLDDNCSFAFAKVVTCKNGIYYFKGYRPDINGDWLLYNFDLKQYNKGKIKRLVSVRNGRYMGKSELTSSIPFATTGPQVLPFLLTPDSVSYTSFGKIQINNVIIDQEDNYWVGSEEGLYQLFSNAFTAYSREYLPQVWAVTEDKNQNLWFSSFFYGLSKLQDGKLIRYPNHFMKNAAFPYFHPVADKRGRLFFPNAFGMLMADGNKFGQQGEYLFISAYYDNERDLVWGGRNKGAEAFDSNRKKVRTIDEKSGLDVGNNVLTIGKDTSGFYWFGGGAGLARYNWHTNSLKNYKPGNRNTGVFTQRNDFKGRSWFGAKDGLYWYNTKADSLCKIERDELSDVVNMLEPIDNSWLIVSQPYGIYLMDLQKYYQSGEVVLHLYNEKNGFLGIEPGQDGAFTDSKGNIWMTTSTELVKLDPQKLKPGKNYLGVRIDKLNGQRLPFTAQHLVLPRNQNSAVLTIDAICFNRPNPVQYSWKLENDTVWSAWQTEDYAVLSDLSDGENILNVRARVTGLPLDNPAQDKISIIVNMAIYRQTWFFPALFALISLFGIVFLILALLKMKRASREAKVFQVQAIQSQMNPHFIFNVLASLQTMILKANISKANDYLVKLADLIRGFLEASAGTGTLKSPQSPDGQVTLSSEIKMLTEFVDFQQVINPGKFDFEIKTDEKSNPENELIPPMLIQPFAENAIRHGLLQANHKGLLTITFHKLSDVLIIEISDNGVGIEKAGQLLDRSAMRYTSRGKELTLNRVKLLNQLGFNIEINTVSNSNGTTVIIKIRK